MSEVYQVKDIPPKKKIQAIDYQQHQNLVIEEP